MNKNTNYSRPQLILLVVLRVLIGWYFLYEGISKVLTPKWTSFGYLRDSKGIFAPLFNSFTENPSVMNIVDFLNIYGLIIIGLSLVLGAYVKIGSIGGIGMLVLYYLSHPALIDAHYLLRPEGTYMWVDKNLIMLCTLLVIIYFPTSMRIGLDRFIFRNKNTK